MSTTPDTNNDKVEITMDDIKEAAELFMKMLQPTMSIKKMVGGLCVGAAYGGAIAGLVAFTAAATPKAIVSSAAAGAAIGAGSSAASMFYLFKD